MTDERNNQQHDESNTPPTHLTVRLNPRLCYVCNTLQDTLQISRSQVVKLALEHYHATLFPPNVSQTCHSHPRAHGINTFFKYKESIHPPSYTENTKKEEEEEGNSNSTNTATTSEAFETWFDLMPLFHGYRPGRDDCLKEWVRQDLDSKADEVMDATRRFKRSKSWKDGYNPMPLSFLAKKRWLDAPPEEEDFFVAT